MHREFTNSFLRIIFPCLPAGSVVFLQCQSASLALAFTWNKKQQEARTLDFPCATL